MKMSTDKLGRKISPDKLFEDDVVRQQFHDFIGTSKSLGKSFQGININLGIGQGKTTAKGSKGSGSGGITPSNKPTTPKPDEPKVTKSNNGLELILEQKPIAKTKTTTKQLIEQAKKKKQKKQSQGSDYYLSTEVIRATPTQQSQLAFGLPSMKLDFGQSLRQEFSLGQIINPQSKQQVKQQSKQQSQVKQRQPSATIQRPIMARGYPRPYAVMPFLAMPLPFTNTPAQQQQRPMPFMPWFQQGAYRGKRKKGKKGKQGKQGWYVPRVDPLGLTKQFKSGDGTDMTFKYWGTGNMQTKVGYF